MINKINKELDEISNFLINFSKKYNPIVVFTK